MISVPLARALLDAGLGWTPRAGDRFVVADRDMDDQVFVLSDMTVEVHDLPAGHVVRFNGTTEWALDSLELDEVVWLPHEEQLRDLLGSAFVGLSRTADGYAVAVTRGSSITSVDGARPPGVGDQVEAVVVHADAEACDAYARALLPLLPFDPRQVVAPSQ